MPNCELCGEPMPLGEEMFKFHGYSGPCPKPPLPREPSATDRLIAALLDARAAINPPDIGGISLHEWNGRLKEATARIDATLEEVCRLQPPKEAT